MQMNNHAVLSRLPYALKDAEGVLCHVTPTANRASILEFGISPDYCQDRMHCCWFVDTAHLLWAIAHVSARHGVMVGDLTIFAVAYKERFIRTGLRGVFIRRTMTMPKALVDVLDVVSAYEESAIYNIL